MKPHWKFALALCPFLLAVSGMWLWHPWKTIGAGQPKTHRHKSHESAQRAPEPTSVASFPQTIGDAWKDPRNPVRQAFAGKRLDLWSLQPLSSPAPPPVQDSAWCRSPLDAFVLAKMEASHQRPAPEADRHTLLRRLTFDLTGLPPTPEETTAFLEDTSPRAYEALVDRLLDSPAYGEHQAREWLDVARYSDSNGFDYDEFRPQAWRYRDYVVRSFNADKPFDQFVQEQLAGDEMVDGPPKDASEQDRLIATGFLRIGPYDNSAVKFGEQLRCRTQVLSDIVETTGSAFLGLTFSCCRCHDHKYDPLTQEDYYRLRAVFEGVQPNDTLWLDLAPLQARLREEEAAMKALERDLEAVRAPVVARLQQEKISQLPEAEKSLLALDGKPETRSFIKAKIRDLLKAIQPDPSEVEAHLTDEEKLQVARVKAKIAELEKTRQPSNRGFLVTDSGPTPPETHVLAQGDFAQPLGVVPPGIPSVFNPNPLAPATVPRPQSSGRRSALAQWLISPQNPLTARVTVNRLWQADFGVGLQPTANDFGYAGARPTHPELLDWLASELIRQGWSLKSMHRLLVTSATYRQGWSSASQPGGAAFAGHPPRRLSAEALRDALLSVSGRLQSCGGGPPRWPELPQEVLASNPGLLIENDEKTRGWYPSPKEQLWVRSLYLVQKRSVHVPLLDSFDLPENNLSCARRNVSTVAPQALTLLNSPFALEVARAFADRVEREAGSAREAEVQRVFAVALQRPPDPEELHECVAFVSMHSLHELCRTIFNINEFSYVD